MGVIGSYLASSLNDTVLPYLRGPVEKVFDGVVQHKGLPDRQDFRELRNRVDMLDYNAREATRKLNELSVELKRVRERIESARAGTGRSTS
jgi:hypothetical protein